MKRALYIAAAVALLLGAVEIYSELSSTWEWERAHPLMSWEGEAGETLQGTEQFIVDGSGGSGTVTSIAVSTLGTWTGTTIYPASVTTVGTGDPTAGETVIYNER